MAAGDTIIKVTNTFLTNISNSVVNVGVLGGSATLGAGDEITLIDATAGGLSATGITQGSGLQGVSTLYEFDVYAANDCLTAKVTETGVNPDATSLSMGRASAMATLRQGGDLVADNGIQNLLGVFEGQDAQASRASPLALASLASLAPAADWSGPTFFAAAGGGHYSIKAGRRAGVDGVAALAGLGWRNLGSCGSLFLGVFFETGYADYDSDNVYRAGRASVKGDGDTRYYGGGLLARHDWHGGFYAEASARAGAVKNDFAGGLVGGSGRRASYDITSAYFGAHAGLGFRFRPSASMLLDVSAKYLWTRQDSDRAVVDGDRVKFKADDSHRVRVGARYSYAVNECLSPYVGAAFEYEFDAKSRAGTSFANYGVPSLRGGSGIGELGVAYRRGGFSADLGLQGHVGKREAVTGSLRVGWSF